MAPVSIVVSGISPTILIDAETDENGLVIAPPYLGEEAGEDVIEFVGVVDGEIVACNAGKIWVEEAPTCEVAPPAAINPVGTEHVVIATFRRADGTTVSRLDVSVSVAGVKNHRCARW